jgi:hypothetical protein
MAKIDELSKNERIEKGKQSELKILNCLECYYGQTFEEASRTDDLKRGIDVYRVSTKGKKESLQLKFRHGKPDLIYERFMPYYGIKSPNTQSGRDHNKDYEVFICKVDLQDKSLIWEIKKKALMEVVDAMDKEFFKWARKHNLKACRVFKLKKLPCEVWHHVDAQSGRPKAMYFMPGDIFNRVEYEYSE